jgi:excisionase family DNA binding protein
MVKLNFDSLPEQVYILRQEICEIKRLLQEGRKATQEEQPDKILNVEEAARFLRVKRQTIYEKVKKGELPVCKTPGTKRLFFSYSDLMNYIKRGRIKTNAEIAQEVDNYLINKKRG